MSKPDRRVELHLIAHLPPHPHGKGEVGFRAGADAFYALLHEVEKRPAFKLGWRITGFEMWKDKEAFTEYEWGRMQSFEDPNDGGDIGLIDNAPATLGDDRIFHDFGYSWSSLSNMLNVEFLRLRDDYTLRVADFVDLIEIITQWQRPEHLWFGPSLYYHNHHASARGPFGKIGANWMTWVDKPLRPDQVPEAHLVKPMAGGTLVVSHNDIWQAYPPHPDYSEAAIQRTQDVEMRLNTLGALPSVR